jgi:hypothetical protein
MIPTTYFASKAKHWQLVGALAAAVPLHSNWHDWAPNKGPEPTPDQWKEHSERCLRQAAEASVCLLYYEKTEFHFGSLLEAGSCLGAGGMVYLVADSPLPFLRHHPRVKSFDTLADAVKALLA